MIERFQGARGKELLLDAISEQFLVQGNREIAERVLQFVELRRYQVGSILITQGAPDNDLYFLLIGRVSIQINGREIANRTARQQVGEMALIDPAAKRSATVIATEDVVAAKISEAHFALIANQFPTLWRRIAVELSTRLQQRSVYIRRRNDRPTLFLGSSRESLPVLEAISDGLKSLPITIRPWTEGVFGASKFPIEDLEQQIGEADFAALVLGPDDKVISRSKESDAPRDNVVFEVGLFMGALGRLRTYLVLPRNSDIRIPTDLLGLTPIKYSLTSGVLSEDLMPVRNELVALIDKYGPR